MGDMASMAGGMGGGGKKKKLGEQEGEDTGGGGEGEEGIESTSRSSPQSKSAGDDIGDAGMQSSNPYAQAIGAAFKVLGARNKRQRERTQALMSSVNAQQGNMAKGAQAMTQVAGGFRL